MARYGKVNTCTIGDNVFESFETLTTDELALMEENMVEVSYKKGEIICKQGTFASHVILLKEGLSKIFIEGCSDSLILRILPEGNMIGLSSMFKGNNVFPYSAQAYLDCEVQQIDINIFKQIISSNAKFATEIIGLLSENAVIAFGRFFCLTKKQTYGRFADILLCLANRIYKTSKFPMELSRRELAELSGMSVESTARIITKFKQEGLLKVTDSHFEINDFEKLVEISEKG